MKRKLFNLLSIVSLVMMLATGCLWLIELDDVRGVTYVRYPSNTSCVLHFVGWGGRHLHWQYIYFPSDTPEPEGVDFTRGIQFAWWDRPVSTFWNRLGFRRLGPAGRFSGGSTPTYIGAIELPGWFLVSTFSLLPLVQLFRRWNRTLGPGLCAACGYDLRATPDRCPECGTIATTGAKV